MIFRRASWSSMSGVPWAAISRLDRRQRPLLLLRAIAAVWRTRYGQRPCGAHRDFHRQNALKPARCHRRMVSGRTDQPSLDAFIDSHFEIRSAKPPPGVATSRDINGDMVSLYFSLWNVPKSTAEIDRCLEPHTCLESHCLFLSRLSLGKIAERPRRHPRDATPKRSVLHPSPLWLRRRAHSPACPICAQSAHSTRWLKFKLRHYLSGMHKCALPSTPMWSTGLAPD